MGKIKDNAGLTLITEQHLTDLRNTIAEMDEKRGRVFLKWLETQNNYLKWEVRFDPKYLKRYKRKDVVHVQYGFNTGSEHGGPHWAVVLDDNKQSCPTIIVIPLGSLEEGQGQGEEDVHPDDVFLGQIPSINNNLVYAIPNQIRAISKLRITKPKKVADKSYQITDDQLDLIDKKLFQLFFKNSKVIHELIAAHVQSAVGKKVGE